MIETLTVISLCFLYLAFFRPGKIPPLDNPLVIERPGQYKIRLAPKLNLVLPFVESIAGRIAPTDEMKNCQSVKFFAVRDQQIAENQNAVYFLVLTFQHGMLDIQGVRPSQAMKSSCVDWIIQLTEDTIIKLPIESKYSGLLDSHIIEAVQDAAHLHKLDVNWLIININKKTIIQRVLSGKDLSIDFGLNS